MPHDEEYENSLSNESDAMQIQENHVVIVRNQPSRANYNRFQPNNQGTVRYKNLTEKYTHEECMPPERYVPEDN